MHTNTQARARHENKTSPNIGDAKKTGEENGGAEGGGGKGARRGEVEDGERGREGERGRVGGERGGGEGKQVPWIGNTGI